MLFNFFQGSDSDGQSIGDVDVGSDSQHVHVFDYLVLVDQCRHLGDPSRVVVGDSLAHLSYPVHINLRYNLQPGSQSHGIALGPKHSTQKVFTPKHIINIPDSQMVESQEQELNLICRYNDISNLKQLVGGACILFFSVLFLVFIIRQMIILYRFRNSVGVKIIYVGMLLWGVGCSVGYSLKILEYELVKDVEEYAQYSNLSTNILPRLTVFCDLMTATVIQTILAIASYYWIKNILYFLAGLSIRSSLYDDKYCFPRTLNKIAGFYIISSRVMAFLFLFGMMLVSYRIQSQLIDGYTLFIAIQTVLVTVYLMYGACFMIRNFLKIAVTDQTRNQTMKCQSYALTVVCVFRFLVDFAFYVISFTSSIKLREYKPDLCVQYPDKISYLIVSIVAVLTLHFLPITILLILYEPQQEAVQSSLGDSCEQNLYEGD